MSEDSAELTGGNESLTERILDMQFNSFREGLRLSADSVFKRYPQIAVNEKSRLAILYQDYRLCPAEEQNERLRGLLESSPNKLPACADRWTSGP
ncbi:MAG: hypothetical protein AAF802_17895 [Planctomycetota bacterium]